MLGGSLKSYRFDSDNNYYIMKNFIFLLIISIAFSCSSSSNVVRKSFLQQRKYNKGVHLSIKKRKKITSPSPSKKKSTNKQVANSVIYYNSSSTLPKEKVKPPKTTRKKTSRFNASKTLTKSTLSQNTIVYINDNAINPKLEETPDPTDRIYKKAKLSKNIGLGMLALSFLIIPFFVAIGLYIHSQNKLNEYIKVKTILNNERKEYLSTINNLALKMQDSARKVKLSLAFGLLLILLTLMLYLSALGDAVLIIILPGLAVFIYFIVELTINMITYFKLFSVIKKEKTSKGG